MNYNNIPERYEYKGYFAEVHYNSETGLYEGEVINADDVITFKGEIEYGIEDEFCSAIDDYLRYKKMWEDMGEEDDE